ncbi:hypothetical protein HOF40_02125 [Candidatus Parcubacteria bacterium]|jgi:hypothetical protein|nr:hypothetical protein [Candidatus Parcubacteria bacterium]
MKLSKFLIFCSVIAAFCGVFGFAEDSYAAIVYINSSTGNDTTGDGSSGTPYKTFHKGYTQASADDTLNLTGTFDWTDADETGDTNTSGYTLGKDIIIQGQGANQTFVQAESAYDVADRRVFTISSSASTTIKNLSIRYGKQSGTNGGCLYQFASTNLTLQHVEVYSCHASGITRWGGGIYTAATTTIENSAIHDNLSGSNGGGIANQVGSLYLTNSTVYSNQQTAGIGGGGIYTYGDGTVSYVTNSTITNNTASWGGGINVYVSSTLYLKNSIVAGNISNTNVLHNDFYESLGYYVSGGHNIFGYADYGNSAPTATTGDWSDADDDDTYDLFTIGTTGTINFDSAAANNDNPNYTKNWALLVDSIAIDNATTTVHGIVAIPSADQRTGAYISGGDIGSYEYGATLSPISGAGISSLSPVDDATDVDITDNLTITFDESITTSTGDIVIYEASDDSVFETIDATGALLTTSDSLAFVINPTTNFGYETAYYVTIAETVFDDSSNDSYAGITASTTWSFTTANTPTCSTITNAATYNAYPTCGVATCNSGFILSGGACIAQSAGASTPPSTPSVLKAPVITSEGDILFDVDNVKYIAVSESETFDGVSWEEYKNSYKINDKTLYIKFRSSEGGESDVFKIEPTKQTPSESTPITYEDKLIKYPDSPKVYIVEDGKKRWIQDEETFSRLGFKWSDLVTIDFAIVFEDGNSINVPDIIPISFSRDLRFGMTGADVKALQQYLNNNGFAVAPEGYPGAIGNETEFFGHATQNALIKFQESKGLPTFGYFGPMTRRVIMSS